MITIYVDMDGVLCDFSKKYRELYSTNKHSVNLFKDFCNSGMFYELEPMPNYYNLINFLFSIESSQISIEILSSLGRAENYEKVYQDKSKWLDDRNIFWHRNFVISKKYKQNFANCKSILIDDKKENIDQFREKGGVGILYDDSKWEEMESEILFQVNKMLQNGEIYPKPQKKKLIYSRENRKTIWI